MTAACQGCALSLLDLRSIFQEEECPWDFLGNYDELVKKSVKCTPCNSELQVNSSFTLRCSKVTRRCTSQKCAVHRCNLNISPQKGTYICGSWHQCLHLKHLKGVERHVEGYNSTFGCRKDHLVGYLSFAFFKVFPDLQCFNKCLVVTVDHLHSKANNVFSYVGCMLGAKFFVEKTSI